MINGNDDKNVFAQLHKTKKPQNHKYTFVDFNLYTNASIHQYTNTRTNKSIHQDIKQYINKLMKTSIKKHINKLIHI